MRRLPIRQRLTQVSTALLVATQLTLLGPGGLAGPATTLAAPAAAPLAQTVGSSTVRLKVLAAATVTIQNPAPPPPAPPVAPPPTVITAGDPFTAYNYVIVKDDSGDPHQDPLRTGACSTTDPAYPKNCTWPSIHANSGGTAANVVATGDNTTLNATTALTLPNGKYHISVLGTGANYGMFKIAGEPFTLPLPATAAGAVAVNAHVNPLKTGTVRVHVFEDDNAVNGEWDIPNEHGLAGFVGHLSDVLAEVTNDWYANPLCTQYVLDVAGNIALDPVTLRPTPIAGTGGRCVSDANGDLVFPNLGPDRYAVTVVPPNGTSWIQTTTLEGNHDWDYWMPENDSGYDAERIIGSSRVPAVPAGFVRPTSLAGNADTPTTGTLAVTGGIRGKAWGIHAYSPPVGGIPAEGLPGNKLDTPVDRPYVALGDLLRGDGLVYVGRGNPDGTFAINHVPDGPYKLTVWDANQDYLLSSQNVTVLNGLVTDVGNFLMPHWFSVVEGTLFFDTVGDGVKKAGMVGVPGVTLTLRSRDGSVQDQGTVTAITDASGHFTFREAYPLGQWVVLELGAGGSLPDKAGYLKTTGFTFQTDNQPLPTTVKGDGRDISTFNLVGLHTTLDWGVKTFAADRTNSGIYGIVTYGTTRNELDARYAAIESYQGAIPGVTVNLYGLTPCPTPLPVGTLCGASPNGGLPQYRLSADGSYMKGPLLNTTVSDTWERPKNCVARDMNGVPQQFLFLPTAANSDCLEAPAMGNQVSAGFAKLNGSYTFKTIKKDPISGAPIAEKAIPGGDYLVEVAIPTDAAGKNLFKITKEEDANIFTGDKLTPQAPPWPCSGPQHKVHVVSDLTQALFDPRDPANLAKTGVFNPDFLIAGGSPSEGALMPLCTSRIVTLPKVGGLPMRANFELFTDVPLPGKFVGLVVDNINIAVNPLETFYGEKAGIANLPIGLYDWTGRHMLTIDTDPNGMFEVIMPSTSSYNCPLPAGPCPGVYRFVANDPGQPGRPNPNFSKQYRSIATSFQMWPNLTLPADLAPLPIGLRAEGPGTQATHLASCQLDATTPQLFALDTPYVNVTGLPFTPDPTVTIRGQGFGATQGTGRVTLSLGDTRGLLPNDPRLTLLAPFIKFPLQVVGWSDRQITVRVPQAAVPGQFQLSVTANNGQSSVNGLSLHILGSNYAEFGLPAYTPTVYEVGPLRAYPTIQAALEAAAADQTALVIVYPNIPSAFNPLGAYFENVILHSPAKLQGVGPGGVYADGSHVFGSTMDGSLFNADPATSETWRALKDSITFSGQRLIGEAATITVLANDDPGVNPFTVGHKAAIDGFTVQGGDQLGFAIPVASVTQGGGVYANQLAHYLRITNNVLQSNGGAYGGAIRMGSPYVGSNNNDNLLIANNRIVANGGGHLAGAIGLFAGTGNYDVSYNDICGNFSAEYGGGISHFGLSPGGNIHDNRIIYNESYDEGAGIIIAGELTTSPTTMLSAGAGPVNIFNNKIQSNIANDDGGGIRFLMAGNNEYNVYNNFITNNVSTHEGGGIAINDAPNVRIFNNTIMKNLTTATAVTSDGSSAPAGIATIANSVLLQATLPPSAPRFSNPLLFNNILSDNRAGTYNRLTTKVTGLGLPGDTTPIDRWDMGVVAVAGARLSPTNSVLSSGHPDSIVASASNRVGVDPLVRSAYDTRIVNVPFRADPRVANPITVALDVPISQLGDYHLQGSASPAYNLGAASKAGVNAPIFDIDYKPRPSHGNGYDAGGHQVQP